MRHDRPFSSRSRAVSRFVTAVSLLIIVLLTVTENTAAQAALKIVVIEGEDAINIIQQKTAVAPVVEVRDRNDQPVAGAVVRFAIQGGRASFNGARTLSVTTNVAGRAAVSGLTPSGSGVFQITASAAFNGQTAAVTIAQTNVMTAAQAASVAGASGGSSGGASAGGAAGGAGGGGGVSATTLGIVGGAVAGGTIVAKEVLKSGVVYKGPFSMTTTLTRVFKLFSGTCFLTQALNGTVTAEVDEQGGTLSGSLVVEWFENQKFQSGVACGENSGNFKEDTDFESPANNIQVSWSTGARPVSVGTVTRDFVFTGVLSGDTITGTIGIKFSDDLNDSTENHPLVTGAVTMQKQP